MTLRLVPGGPDPMIKGFGSLSSSTMVAKVGIRIFLVSCHPFVTLTLHSGYNYFKEKNSFRIRIPTDVAGKKLSWNHPEFRAFSANALMRHHGSFTGGEV